MKLKIRFWCLEQQNWPLVWHLNKVVRISHHFFFHNNDLALSIYSVETFKQIQIVNVWNWDFPFQTVPKSGHLKCPISDIRLRFLCLKSGQPNCPKSRQTKLGCFEKLVSYIFEKKWPRLVSQGFCPDLAISDRKRSLKSGLSGNGTQLSCLKFKLVRILDIHCT